MILRLLLAIVIVGLAVFLFRRLFRAVSGKSQSPPKRVEQFDETVACHKCGVRIPKSEAVHKDGHDYCCPEHAEHE